MSLDYERQPTHLNISFIESWCLLKPISRLRVWLSIYNILKNFSILTMRQWKSPDPCLAVAVCIGSVGSIFRPVHTKMDQGPVRVWGSNWFLKQFTMYTCKHNICRRDQHPVDLKKWWRTRGMRNMKAWLPPECSWQTGGEQFEGSLCLLSADGFQVRHQKLHLRGRIQENAESRWKIPRHQGSGTAYHSC